MENESIFPPQLSTKNRFVRNVYDDKWLHHKSIIIWIHMLHFTTPPGLNNYAFPAVLANLGHTSICNAFILWGSAQKYKFKNLLLSGFQAPPSAYMTPGVIFLLWLKFSLSCAWSAHITFFIFSSFFLIDLLDIFSLPPSLILPLPMPVCRDLVHLHEASTPTPDPLRTALSDSAPRPSSIQL